MTVLAVFLTGGGCLAGAPGCSRRRSRPSRCCRSSTRIFCGGKLLTAVHGWCLYFFARVVTSRISKSRHVFGFWRDAMLAGCSPGFAVACKISVWPTAVLVVLSIVIAMLRDRRGPPRRLDAVLATLIAGVVTFGGFRVAQPYAFVGNSALEWQYTTRDCAGLDRQKQICTQTRPMPIAYIGWCAPCRIVARPILAPSSRWVAELQRPRLPPAENLTRLLAGSGPTARRHIPADQHNVLRPGSAARHRRVARRAICIAGAARAARYAYLIPTLWTLGFFLYQGTQYVKSIRYQLPIYPMLCVLAAAWSRSARIGAARQRLRWRSPRCPWRGGGRDVAWALAFMQIYAEDAAHTGLALDLCQRAHRALADRRAGGPIAARADTQLPGFQMRRERRHASCGNGRRTAHAAQRYAQFS